MMRPARGFTLLELLIVMAIFALMSVMAYGGLNSVLKTRTRVEQSLDRTAALQKAFQKLRNDFQEVRIRPARDAFGQIQPALLGLQGPVVEFTRAGWRNPLLQPRPVLERVRYRLEDEALVRESFRVLDQAQDSQPVKLKLMENVESLQLRYLDANREWREAWPPPTATGAVGAVTTPPPLAVEMIVELENQAPMRFLFRLGLDVLPAGLKLGEELSSGTAGGTGSPGGSAGGGSGTGGTTGNGSGEDQ